MAAAFDHLYRYGSVSDAFDTYGRLNGCLDCQRWLTEGESADNYNRDLWQWMSLHPATIVSEHLPTR